MGIKQTMPEHIVIYDDGTEEQANGFIWKVDDNLYFDKFAKGSRQIWVERFNQLYGATVLSRREIYDIIGPENFADFKRKWAATYLRRVIAYQTVKGKDPYTWENLFKMMADQIHPDDRAVLELWLKNKKK